MLASGVVCTHRSAGRAGSSGKVHRAGSSHGVFEQQRVLTLLEVVNLLSALVQEPLPSVIRIVWDGQEYPVPLRVPPRIG
jgi:hypothetical protein